jgi:Fe-S-cluster-containing dehydrogenase component
VAAAAALHRDETARDTPSPRVVIDTERCKGCYLCLVAIAVYKPAKSEARAREAQTRT